jgi:arginyl-tRNA synthetase
VAGDRRRYSRARGQQDGQVLFLSTKETKLSFSFKKRRKKEREQFHSLIFVLLSIQYYLLSVWVHQPLFVFFFLSSFYLGESFCVTKMAVELDFGCAPLSKRSRAGGVQG